MGSSTHVRILALASALSLAPFAVSRAEAPKQLKYPAKKRPHAIRRGPSEVPDPAPLYAKRRHQLVVKWDRNAPGIQNVNTVDLPKPESIERWTGRFALELFDRGVLVERVRFNFPMLGAEVHEGRRSVAAAIDANVVTTADVAFPAVDRGDKLELRDRATGRRWQLAWPPRIQALVDIPVDAGVFDAPEASAPLVK